MTVRQYLELLNIDVLNSYISMNFVITKVEGDEHTTSKWYRSTPVRNVSEWLESGSLDKYIVLNTEQPVTYWLSGVNWNGAIMNHRQMSLLVITEEELMKMYGKRQADGTIDFIDKKIKEDIENGKNPWLQPKVEKKDDGKPVKFCSRESDVIAQLVRETLQKGKSVVWVCRYDTFYGVGWDSWAKKQLNDIDCTIEETGHNQYYDYADRLLITPNKK